MADKELAAKLAKRLAFTGETGEESTEGLPSPPAPEIPQKIVDNPYVASDPSVSVDDLILKTLEVQEENNNYQKSLNSPGPSPLTSPGSPSKSPLPPKQTIRDWLLKDQPQAVSAVPKSPVVPVEHHKQGANAGKKSSPETDGSELERKLAAQRAKKSAAKPVENINEAKPKVEETTPTAVEPCSSRVEEPRKTSFEELEEQIQKELDEEERKKAEVTKETQKDTSPVEKEKEEEAKREQSPLLPIPPPLKLQDPPVTVSPKAQKKSVVPSPLLMEAIRQECGIKSPPPPTPPKKTQTPTNSRPQSPIISKKSIVSPLGLFCDPLMSIEPPSSPKPQSPKPVKKSVDENPEELQALLERRNKINEGENVPQFINRKLSLFAEFSEFTRKQIKSLTETFKKYDEDNDGFIDFMELKRMMEKLGEAQTHIALKEIIVKVDEDKDGKINLREFFLLFRLAAKGEIGCSEVFNQLAESIDVSKEGVLAAASFFQAKIAEQTKLSKFEEEIKQEQDERKQEEEEKRQRKEKFLQNKSIFH